RFPAGVGGRCRPLAAGLALCLALIDARVRDLGNGHRHFCPSLDSSRSSTAARLRSRERVTIRILAPPAADRALAQVGPGAGAKKKWRGRLWPRRFGPYA